MAETLEELYICRPIEKGASAPFFYVCVCHILRIAAYIKTIVNRNKADEMSGI